MKNKTKKKKKVWGKMKRQEDQAVAEEEKLRNRN